MSRVQLVEVSADDAGIRLDRWFKRHFPTLAHGRLERMVRKGDIRVDGGRAKSGQRLESGQIIRVPPMPADSPPAARTAAPDPRDMEALRNSVLHRDDHLIVLNKAPGLAVQGGSNLRHHVDGLLDGLRFGSDERPRLVHRLDKDTSGILLIARKAKSARMLTEAFRAKTTRKLYWAAVVGVPRPREGRIDLSVAKLPGPQGERVAAHPDGKQASTRYRTVDQAGQDAAWLALEPETGRTHQLRVHCAALGMPIIGDAKYGGTDAFVGQGRNGGGLARKLHLHARAIRLPHPAGGVFEISAPLPPHMSETWHFLGFDSAGDPEPFDTFDEIFAAH